MNRSLFRSWIVAALGVLGLATTGHAQADNGVLIFGGTGELGVEIVKRLVDAGEEVTVFVRPTSDRAKFAGMTVSFAVGDILDGETVRAAIESTKPRVIIDATANNSASDTGFYEPALRNIVGPAKEAEVKQILHHGSVAAGDNMNEFPMISIGIEDRMRQRLEDKGRAEIVLIESGVPYTIIRNGQIDMSNPPASGRAFLTDDQTQFGHISRADLAVLTMECLDTCMNQILHGIDPGKPVPGYVYGDRSDRTR